MKGMIFPFAMSALLSLLVGCGDDTGLPAPPPPSGDAGVSGAPRIVSITRTDPMGCQPGVRSNVVLKTNGENVVGVVHEMWSALSGCDVVSGADQDTATFSCPHSASYAGSVTIRADNGSVTRAFTVPICGSVTLQ